VTARDNLRKAETLFRNTFDQAPLGIVYADRSGKFLRFNHAFCTMLGFDAGELADKDIGDVTGAEDVARVSTELERLWNGEIQFVDLEKRYTRKGRRDSLGTPRRRRWCMKAARRPSTRSSSCAISPPGRRPPRNSNACTSN